MGLFLPLGRHRPNGGGEHGDMNDSPSNPLHAHAAVTSAYWAFELSDGALRILVLLQFNGLGFKLVQSDYLFGLYEVAGIRHQPYGRLDRGALRAGADIVRGPRPADHSLVGLGAIEPGVERRCPRRLCDGGSRAEWGSQGFGQDVDRKSVV